MREFGYKLNEALSLGYYEAFRLWTICDELRARDLQHLYVLLDQPHSTEDKRQEVWEWLQNKQPRQNVKNIQAIPQEVVDKFQEAFYSGRR